MAYIGNTPAELVTELDNGVVTTAKLADDAVTAAKIIDGTIISDDLNDGIITNAKVSASAAIAASKLAISGGSNITLQSDGTFDLDNTVDISGAYQQSGNDRITSSGGFRVAQGQDLIIGNNASNTGKLRLYLGSTSAYSVMMRGTTNQREVLFEGSSSSAAYFFRFQNEGTGGANVDIEGALQIGGTTAIEADGDANLRTVRVFGGDYNGNATTGETLFGSFSSGNTDINNLLSGSQFGAHWQGPTSGHVVIGLRDNDVADSFAVLCGSGDYTTDSTYDRVLMRLSANGNAEIPGNLYQNHGSFLRGKDEDGNTTRLIGINTDDAIYMGDVDGVTTGDLRLRGPGAAAQITMGSGTVSINKYTAITGDKDSQTLSLQASLATANGPVYGDYQELQFKNTSGTPTYSGIRQIANSWQNSDTGLSFWTTQHGGSYAERMRLDGDGRLGLNTTDPIYDLDVRGTGYFAEQLRFGSQKGTASWSDSGTKYYTNLCTFSGYQYQNSALILTTNIPGHNISGNGNMLAIRIVGYNYAGRYNTDFWVGCYSGENGFYSTTLNGACPYDWEDKIYVYTDSNGKVAFQFGDTSTTITGEFAVAEFVQGYSNVNTSYATGWSFSVVSTLPTQNNKTALSGFEYHPVHMQVEDTVSVGTSTTNKAGTLNIYDTGNNYLNIAGVGSNSFRFDLLGSSAQGNILFRDFDLDVDGAIYFNSDGEHVIGRYTTSPITSANTDTTLVRGRQLDLYAYDDVHIRAGTGDTIQFTYGGTTRVKMHSDGQVYCPNSSGGSIMGDYSYTQANDGDTSSWQNILGPNGNAFITDVSNNRVAEVTIQVIGTGTTGAWCRYRYENNSDTNSAVLTHLAGNSGASSNRPYMQLSGQNMQWNMNHTGSYTVVIKVETVGSLLT